jgi:hypothetical protein
VCLVVNSLQCMHQDNSSGNSSNMHHLTWPAGMQELCISVGNFSSRE